MDIIETTRQLGAAIQQDETYINYMLAKEKNDHDTELQELISEFNLLRIKLNNEFNGDNEKDDEKVKKINQDLKDCYNKIMQNENMTLFNDAKAELDALIKKINGIIELSIEGQDPFTCEPDDGGSCGGSCSSCSGCH